MCGMLECDFCGKPFKTRKLASTAFGLYCIGCLNIMAHQANKGIAELEEDDYDDEEEE